MLIFVLQVLFLLLTLALSDKQPNIVVFLVDDLGYNDVGFRGSNQVKTPNIDALSYNGVVLSRFYSLPTCTSSRAALLTGNYPIRSGMQGIPMSAGENRYLPWNISTLPEKLKEINYKTHLVGKWHLGHAYRNATPTGRGFDSHYGYWNGYVGYFDHSTGDPSGLDMHKNFIPDFETVGQYATDLFTDKAIDVIKSHNYSENPLFLLLSHLAPHTGKLDPTRSNTTVLEEKDSAKMNQNFGYIEDVNRRRYVDIVQSVDDSLGKIMNTIHRKGILENTMVLFMSDNGGQTFGVHENFASNWPLRGLKFTNLEGGVRGTAILYSKKVALKGIPNHNLIHMTDWLPTFYKAGNGDLNNLGNIDGIDQLDTILYTIPTKRKELLINIDEAQNYVGILGDKGKYKYINGTIFEGVYDGYFGATGREPENPNYNTSAVLSSPTNNVLKRYTRNRLNARRITFLRSTMRTKNCRKDIYSQLNCNPCLFNLEKDPCETTNIAEDKPGLVKKLSKKSVRFWSQLVPQQNKLVDINSNPSKFGGVWSTWLDANPAR